MIVTLLAVIVYKRKQLVHKRIGSQGFTSPNLDATIVTYVMFVENPTKLIET